MFINRGRRLSITCEHESGPKGAICDECTNLVEAALQQYVTVKEEKVSKKKSKEEVITDTLTTKTEVAPAAGFDMF